MDARSRTEVLSDDGDEIDFCFFSVSGDQLLPLFDTMETFLLHKIMAVFDSPRVYPGSQGLATLCRRLASEAPSHPDLSQRCEVLRIAVSILNVEFRRARVERERSVGLEDRVAAVLDELTPTEMMNISVSQLARKFACGERQLNRLFHQQFGFSVSGLRQEMRLLKAVGLLRDHELMVGDVAKRCGFRHLGLFHNCFRKRFGLTPGQCREDDSIDISGSLVARMLCLK